MLIRAHISDVVFHFPFQYYLYYISICIADTAKYMITSHELAIAYCVLGNILSLRSETKPLSILRWLERNCDKIVH